MAAVGCTGCHWLCFLPYFSPLFPFFSCYPLGVYGFLFFSFFQPHACNFGIFFPPSFLMIHRLGWGAPAGGAAHLAGRPARLAGCPALACAPAPVRAAGELRRSMGLPLGAPAPASLPLRPEALLVITPSTGCWGVCPLPGSGGVGPGVKPNLPGAALRNV